MELETFEDEVNGGFRIVNEREDELFIPYEVAMRAFTIFFEKCQPQYILDGCNRFHIDVACIYISFRQLGYLKTYTQMHDFFFKIPKEDIEDNFVKVMCYTVDSIVSTDTFIIQICDVLKSDLQQNVFWIEEVSKLIARGTIDLNILPSRTVISILTISSAAIFMACKFCASKTGGRFQVLEDEILHGDERDRERKVTQKRIACISGIVPSTLRKCYYTMNLYAHLLLPGHMTFGF